MINDFLHTRVNPFERFVKWHRLNASNLVDQDEDLRQALEKMETSDHKKTIEDTITCHQLNSK